MIGVFWRSGNRTGDMYRTIVLSGGDFIWFALKVLETQGGVYNKYGIISFISPFALTHLSREIFWSRMLVDYL